MKSLAISLIVLVLSVVFGYFAYSSNLLSLPFFGESSTTTTKTYSRTTVSTATISKIVHGLEEFESFIPVEMRKCGKVAVGYNANLDLILKGK